MVITAVEQHALGWLITAQSAEFARTRDWRTMLVGHGPYLVDGQDASVHQIPVMTSTQDWETAYRHQVRGETPPRARRRVRRRGPHPPR
jgi:hypothetical protein